MLAEAVLATRLSLNALPPSSYGLGAEVVKAPWVLRIDAAYDFTNRGAAAVTLAYPAWHLGDVQVGPLAGLNAGLFYGPVLGKIIGPGENNQPNITLGASLRWQHDRMWLTANPNVNLIWLSPAITFGWQPPRVDLVLPLLGCPPVLEVGYQITPSLSVVLRACILPVGISWKF